MDLVAFLVALGFGALMGWGLNDRHPRHRALPVALGVAFVTGAVLIEPQPHTGLILVTGATAAFITLALNRRSVSPPRSDV